MATSLTFKYDREADILYINTRPPYPEQETEEPGDEVIARLHPTTSEIENLEVLFFSTRLLRSVTFQKVGAEGVWCAAEPRAQCCRWAKPPDPRIIEKILRSDLFELPVAAALHPASKN